MTATTMANFTTPQTIPTTALNTQKATMIAMRPPPAISTPSKKVSPVRSSSAMATTIMPRSGPPFAACRPTGSATPGGTVRPCPSVTAARRSSSVPT